VSSDHDRWTDEHPVWSKRCSIHLDIRHKKSHLEIENSTIFPLFWSADETCFVHTGIQIKKPHLKIPEFSPPIFYFFSQIITNRNSIFHGPLKTTLISTAGNVSSSG
jgi:hypothetical protein